MKTKTFLIALLALTLAMPAMAQEEQPSLDDLLDLETPAPQESEKPADDGSLLDDATRQKLDMEQAADQFKQAVKEMDLVAGRIDDDKNAGPSTQRMQQEIINKLEQVIKAAKQQQQQQQQSGQPGQGQPQQGRPQDSGSQQQAQQQGQQPGQQPGQQQNQGNEANQGDFSPGSAAANGSGNPLEEVGKEWGNLPARIRDELQQGYREKFSPIYKQLTEMYYRRLAEEKE